MDGIEVGSGGGGGAYSMWGGRGCWVGWGVVFVSESQVQCTELYGTQAVANCSTRRFVLILRVCTVCAASHMHNDVLLYRMHIRAYACLLCTPDTINLEPPESPESPTGLLSALSLLRWIVWPGRASSGLASAITSKARPTETHG